MKMKKAVKGESIGDDCKVGGHPPFFGIIIIVPFKQASMVVKTDKMQMTCYFIYVTANSRKGRLSICSIPKNGGYWILKNE